MARKELEIPLFEFIDTLLIKYKGKSTDIYLNPDRYYVLELFGSIFGPKIRINDKKMFDAKSIYMFDGVTEAINYSANMCWGRVELTELNRDILTGKSFLSALNSISYKYGDLIKHVGNNVIVYDVEFEPGGNVNVAIFSKAFLADLESGLN